MVGKTSGSLPKIVINSCRSDKRLILREYPLWGVYQKNELLKDWPWYGEIVLIFDLFSYYETISVDNYILLVASNNEEKIRNIKNMIDIETELYEI